MSQYLSEAFKRLDILNEDTFTINDSGLEDFIKFEEEDEFEDSIDIIDPEATTVDELQDSYIGKVILDCCVCHSKIYKDVEDVVVEDDIANANEECPFCYTTDGYKVIGQVSAFGEEESDKSDEEPKEETDNDELKEGIFGKRKEISLGASELKKGDIVVDDDGSKSKVKKVTKDADGTTEVDFKHGNIVSGSKSTAKYKVLRKESLSEDVNNVNVETDDSIVNVNTDDNGKVTVTTEPKMASIDSEEVITPLEPETQSEISDNVEDGGEIEIDMDEFDEESFDELGEGYLKKVYENVNSFKTSRVSFIKDKLILEGVIKFNSGKSKKTNFIFESREATKSGKVRFIGENKEIARGRKSFTITGRVDNKKFLSESLNYNYGVKGANGKTQRLYGTVKRGK
jgi:hypothetical protein